MKKFLKIDISAMKRLDEAVKTNRPALAASAATQVMALTQLEFSREGKMFHGGWTPLSTGVSKAKTARKRKKNGKLGKARTAKPLLVDTGTLKKSFFVSPSGNGATVGTPVKYAVFHQFGAPAAIPSPGDRHHRLFVLQGEGRSRVQEQAESPRREAGKVREDAERGKQQGF